MSLGNIDNLMIFFIIGFGIIVLSIFVLSIAAIAIRIDRHRQSKRGDKSHKQINNDDVYVNQYVSPRGNFDKVSNPQRSPTFTQTEKPTITKKIMNDKKTLVALLLALSLILVYRYGVIPNRESAEQNTPFIPASAVMPTPSSSVPFPANGTVIINPNLECVAPFSITTPQDSYNYYILLKDVLNKDNKIVIYMNANETLEIDVPIGNYYFYYACGRDWQGDNELFGKNTQCLKGDKILSFYIDTEESVARGHIISLIKQIDGNMHSSEVSRSEILS